MRERFGDRLQNLGFKTYAEYLASDLWKSFKDRYRESGRPLGCAICGGKPIQLHHHDYRNLGNELLTDVDPLCRKHHGDVHALLRERRKPVDQTPWAMDQIRKRIGQAVVGRQNKRRRRKEKALTEEEKLKRQQQREEDRRKHREQLRNDLKKTYKAKEVQLGMRVPGQRKMTKQERRDARKAEEQANLQREREKWNDPEFQMRAAAAGIRRPRGI